MKKVLFLVILLAPVIFNEPLRAQATFILESIPEYTPEDDFIYMAGDFNGWNPGDINHKLVKNNEGLWETVLDGFPDGITLEYKFTRGNWSTVEKGPDGEEIENRSFTFGNGDTVVIIVENWADFGGGGNSTAAENVIIMDDEFYMPQLERTRRIWLYLPPDYDESDRYYPVLYMHDGQNLFDEITSYAGEWEVDETLNELAQQGYQVPIVVGIDNGGAFRIDELTPWYNDEYDAGGQGDEYIDFIVETLKLHIDENYRTLPDAENTGIMGSSLGGLISWYGTLKYPSVFSKSGIFSPAYWINYDSIWNYLHQNSQNEGMRFY
jgi:predicted alpha/beta superfamily hydrolase